MTTELLKKMRDFVRGNIPEIIRNDDNLYEGNLRHYFKILFYHARNIHKPYHNFRHMMHVLWLAYDAAGYYKNRLTKKEIRNLLIAAMFHDFDHPGMIGYDDCNVEIAIRGLKKWVAPIDLDQLDKIVTLIQKTEFPYKAEGSNLDLSTQILLDCDMSQSFSSSWLQQVIFGLSQEMSVSPIAVLKDQEAFISNIQFHTEWAKQKFDLQRVHKIEEAKALLELLE
ncbi:MAG: hypothetical protein JSS12_01580 [Verrucomicrobia bacterium]|nr:hypothetical protein [Verrucomicrobiota bacterium]